VSLDDESEDEDDSLFDDDVDPWEDEGLWNDLGIDDDILYIALLLEHYREHPVIPLDDRDPKMDELIERIILDALTTGPCPDCGSKLEGGTHQGRTEAHCKTCGHRHYLE
jgi:DNA-directed RNA polymerase subunit RPC12/RpoP